MEQQIPNALERIENPILIVLLACLMVAVVALWFWNKSLQQRIYDALLQNVAAMTNLNATLGNMKERLDNIENQLPSQS
jgi:Tfp pilus assembly protein PilO